LKENPDKQVGRIVDTIHFPHLHSDQSLDVALERMRQNRLQLLPVVSRADVQQLLGVVTLSDVLNSYGV
jgi:CIC family chloride channel protein